MKKKLLLTLLLIAIIIPEYKNKTSIAIDNKDDNYEQEDFIEEFLLVKHDIYYLS